MNSKLRFVLFDWGDTLMSEAGPLDVPMADWPEVRCIDGAHEVLASLSKNYSLSIATNATVSRRSDILRALDRVHLRPFFQEVFCYTEMGHKKSELEFWQIALSRLGADKSEVLMIGDSLEQDVLAPMNSGIRAVWLNWKQDKCPPGVAVESIRSLGELPVLLRRL